MLHGPVYLSYAKDFYINTFNKNLFQFLYQLDISTPEIIQEDLKKFYERLIKNSQLIFENKLPVFLFFEKLESLRKDEVPSTFSIAQKVKFLEKNEKERTKNNLKNYQKYFDDFLRECVNLAERKNYLTIQTEKIDLSKPIAFPA